MSLKDVMSGGNGAAQAANPTSPTDFSPKTAVSGGNGSVQPANPTSQANVPADSQPGSDPSQGSGTGNEIKGYRLAEWTMQLPKEIRENPDLAGKLSGFNKLEDFAKSYFQLEGKSDIPGRDAKPEDIAAFWKKLGYPEKPDGYTVAKEQSAASFIAAAHAARLTDGQASALWQSVSEGTTRQLAAMRQAQDAELDATDRALQKEYGEKYPYALEMFNRGIGTGGLKALVINAGLAGKSEIVKAFIALGEASIEAVRRTNQPWPNRIVECVTQTNQILVDMPFVECNNGTFHTFTRRVGLAGSSVRSYYEGTKTVATQTRQVDEPTGMFQAVAEIDADMADHSGDPNGIQRTESIGVMNGMGIQQAQNFIYGKRTDEKKNGVDGFATRLNKIDGVQVFDLSALPHGSSTDFTSIHLVALGDTFLHGIYPKGKNTVGVSVEHEGKVTRVKPDDSEFQVYRTYYKCQWGIAVENPKSIIRLANIPVDLTEEGSIQLVDAILSKGRRMPEGAPTYALYGNYTAQDILDRAAYKKPNVIFPTTDPWGRPMTMLRNFRIRTVEAILDTEDAIA
jgi:hypothetical protein